MASAHLLRQTCQGIPGTTLPRHTLRYVSLLQVQEFSFYREIRVLNRLHHRMYHSAFFEWYAAIHHSVPLRFFSRFSSNNPRRILKIIRPTPSCSFVMFFVNRRESRNQKKYGCR